MPAWADCGPLVTVTLMQTLPKGGAMTGHVSWRDDAACRDADSDLFFPVGTNGPALRRVNEAKRICQACPAQIQCLTWALDHGVTDGVWGGTTADERRAIRRLPQPWRSARSGGGS